MKVALFLPLSLLKLAVQAMTVAYIVVLCAFFSVLALFATPFWVFELATAPTWSFVRVTPAKQCESYLEWMFARTSPQPQEPNTSFVRMWGLEFRYTEWPESAY